MFKRILVPLDGSTGAERAIPVAARLARKAGGSVIFLHGIVPTAALQSAFASPQKSSYSGTDMPEGEKEVLHTGAVEEVVADAARYLAMIPALYAEDLAGVSTEMDVAFGAASPAIPSAARLEHVDLIVLYWHHDAGPGQWGSESLTQQVMRHSPVPLLILNEHAKEMPVLDGARPLRVIVPLDGSLFAETALTPALQLLAQCAGSGAHELCLIYVVDLFAADGQGEAETQRILSSTTQTRQHAERYLQAVIRRLRGRPDYGQDIHISSLVTGGVDVANAILKQIKQIPTSERMAASPLIAIATHGREGIQRLMMGSITERLLNATTFPLLTVCPKETAAGLINFALPVSANN